MKDLNPLKFSKKKTDNAGIALQNNSLNEDERNEALEILSNWRAAHNYPMHIFTNRLKTVSQKLDEKSFTAQRLKRVPSIIKKLKRRYHGNKPSMKLTRMQDIAGCRVVLKNMDLVNELHKKYYGDRGVKHIKVNEKNYIQNPKDDGYRSIHLIYKYNSDKEEKKKFNGLLIEVQIRSKLQHLWATAVEIVDFFTGQAIKSNEGQKDWVDFFRLVSSAFAIMEDCPLVHGTSQNKNILHEAIRKYADKLNVISQMRNWTESLRSLEVDKKKYAHLFLLELDTKIDNLVITSYSKSEQEKAIADYAHVEKKVYDKPDYDVVLVGADNIKSLKQAYPNYFLDTKEFLKFLEKIIKK